MTNPAGALQSTLREWSHLRVPFMIWLVVSTLGGVAGPFGTLEAMGPVPRTFYWSATAGLSILMSFRAVRFARGTTLGRRVAIWSLFVLLLSAVTHLVNTAMFSEWGGWQDWFYLNVIVGITTGAVHLLIWGIKPRAQAQAPQQAEADIFQRRLPIDVRGPLVRIEAQDHYLNVVTQKGSTLILMRLGDAMAELEGKGLQVHRSHWVCAEGVTAHRRDKSRDVLVMADGADVPVSRSFRAKAKEAALF